MKTPEEIKKGLECCHVGDCECERCPYQKTNSCMYRLKQDALEYILLLETGIDQIEKKTKMAVDDAKKAFDELVSRLAQVERENKAMLHDMARYTMCGSCKHFSDREKCPQHDECVYGEIGRFEWRGVCAENTEEDGNA